MYEEHRLVSKFEKCTVKTSENETLKGKCECIDANSGFPVEPKREYGIEFADKIVCSGTKCLQQAADAVRLAKVIVQSNMVDLPFMPNCDGMGLYTVSSYK